LYRVQTVESVLTTIIAFMFKTANLISEDYTTISV